MFISTKSFNPRFQARAYAKGFKTEEIRFGQQLAEVICTDVWSPCIWIDGERKKSNFIESWLCALDFDDGEMTLENAVNNYFADCQHIIATTKSHGIPKGDKPACDRFRVVIPWTVTIKKLINYEYSISKIIEEFSADPSGKDGARFFYPCNQIISINTDPQDFKMETKRFSKQALEQREKYFQRTDNPEYNKNYIKKFFSDKTPFDLRNKSLFQLCCEWCKLGTDQNKIFNYIKSRPDKFNNFYDMTDNDIWSTIRSAYRTITERNSANV